MNYLGVGINLAFLDISLFEWSLVCPVNPASLRLHPFLVVVVCKTNELCKIVSMLTLGRPTKCNDHQTRRSISAQVSRLSYNVADLHISTRYRCCPCVLKIRLRVGVLTCLILLSRTTCNYDGS